MRWHKRLFGLALLFGYLSSASAAEEPFFTGVWVSDAQFCPLMEKIGTRAIFGNDIAIITPELGFVGFEFFCDFDDPRYASDAKSVTMSATCGDVGEDFEAEVYLSLFEGKSEDNRTRFEFNSLYITGNERPTAGADESRYLFARCNDLSEQLLIERTEP